MKQIEELTGQAIFDRELNQSHGKVLGNYKTGSFITTYRDHQLFPLDPDPNEIDIQDIAHALANNCRWTGHTKQFYSVAQHCVMVSNLVEPENALAGLLHDASEAYLSDISRPVKYSEALEGYREVEARLERVINEKFGVPYPMTEDVKRADDMMLVAEGFYLFNKPRQWVLDRLKAAGLDKPFVERFPCWPPVTAKAFYIKRFLELNGVNLGLATDKDFENMERVDGATTQN
jgi:hypothetical protein